MFQTNKILYKIVFAVKLIIHGSKFIILSLYVTNHIPFEILSLYIPDQLESNIPDLGAQNMYSMVC